MSFTVIARQSLALAWPTIIARVLYTMTLFIVTVVLARMGHAVLAASALISTTNVAVNVSLAAILFGVSTIVARHHGANQPESVGNVAQMGVLLAFVLSGISILIFSHIGSLLILCHQPVKESLLTQAYYAGYQWGLPAYFAAMIVGQVTIGVKRPKFSIFTSIVWLIACSVLSYAFAHGALGCPNWGVYGAGFGYGLGCWVTLIVSLLALKYIPYFTQFALFTWHGNFNAMRRIIMMGIHIAMQLSGELLAMGFAGIMVGWLGTNALAGYQIAYQFSLIVVIPLFAMGQIAGIQMSHALGARQSSTLSLILPANLLIGAVYLLIAISVVVVFPTVIINLFMPSGAFNKAIATTAQWLLYLGLLNAFFDGIRNIVTGTLRGFYDTQFAMWVGIVGIWGVAIPVGYLFAFVLHFGVYGISLGFTFAITLCACAVGWRYRTVYKRQFQPHTVTDENTAS